jgi:hypothetical protein
MAGGFRVVNAKAPDLTRSLPDRRSVLSGVLALLAVPSHAWPAPDQAFSTLSAALVGAGNVDPDLARAYETALRDGPLAAAIERLTALAAGLSGTSLLDRIEQDGLQQAANAVVSAWYSGIVDSRVIAYAEALAWNAVPFTKPNGYCGGVFGYWADPPAG